MNANQKTIIAQDLSKLSKRSSQSYMAKLLEVSTAVVSQILNNNWKLISNDMWRVVEAKLYIDTDWITVEISNFKILMGLLRSVQELGISVGISDTPGKSKSETYKHFWKQNIGDAIYVQCKNSWTKKSYLKSLLTAAGQECHGTTEVLLERFIQHLRTIEKPILIIDQFDKLKDPQLDLFMDLYNDLNGKCGFVASGVKALEKRILKGVQTDKIGYAEFYSRIGKKFISLDHITHADVEMICHANGVIDAAEIMYIYQNCDDDLRRVRRDIEKYKLKQNIRQTV